MADDQQRARMSLMGLYENEGRNGRYLRGKLGQLVVWVFPNDRKTQDTHPDWNVFVTEDRKPAAPGRERGTPPNYRTPTAQAERNRSIYRSPVADEEPNLGGRDDEDPIPF